MIPKYVVISLISLFHGQNLWAANFYRVNDGAAANIAEHGRCYRVTNDSGKNLFIPTKTAAEWSAFRTNKPAGVAIGDCQYTNNCFADTNDGCFKTISCSGTSAGEEVKRIKARCHAEQSADYSSAVYSVAWNRITTTNDGLQDYNDWCRIDGQDYPFTGGDLTSVIGSSSLNKASFTMSCRDIDHTVPGGCSIYVVYECAP